MEEHITAEISFILFVCCARKDFINSGMKKYIQVLQGIWEGWHHNHQEHKTQLGWHLYRGQMDNHRPNHKPRRRAGEKPTQTREKTWKKNNNGRKS